MNRHLRADERVVVRMPSRLGDFVLAEPLLRALAAHLDIAGGRAALRVVAPARFLELLRGRFPRAELRGLAGRDGPADYRGAELALLLNGSFASALHAALAAVPRRMGLAGGLRRPFLDLAVVPARERGRIAVGRHLCAPYPRPLPRPFGGVCAEMAALLGVPMRDRRPRLLADAAAGERAERLLEGAGLERGEPYVLVQAGARPRSAKALEPGLARDLVDQLAERAELPIVLVHAAGEEAAAVALAEAATAGRVYLLPEPAGLLELVALAARAALAVAPDGGARHVAEAAGAPTLVLFGPTDPRHTAEHGPRTRLATIEAPCAPCHREVCPLGGSEHLACWKAHDVPRLVAAAREILS